MVSDGQTVHFWPHSVIHNRKAVHLTSLKLGWKVIFWPPLKRQNFRDAYGLNCYPHLISCHNCFDLFLSIFWTIIRTFVFKVCNWMAVKLLPYSPVFRFSRLISVISADKKTQRRLTSTSSHILVNISKIHTNIRMKKVWSNWIFNRKAFVIFHFLLLIVNLPFWLVQQVGKI